MWQKRNTVSPAFLKGKEHGAFFGFSVDLFSGDVQDLYLEILKNLLFQSSFNPRRVLFIMQFQCSHHAFFIGGRHDTNIIQNSTII